jgi:hypothetical protein
MPTRISLARLVVSYGDPNPYYNPEKFGLNLKERTPDHDDDHSYAPTVRAAVGELLMKASKEYSRASSKYKPEDDSSRTSTPN